LIFDEPTRGIDVGAKDEIYQLLTKLSNEGKSIIMISSELPEVLRLSDRIAVMCNGRLTGVIDNKDANQEVIIELATKFSDDLTTVN
jgi:ribose transport system ATP-binding protein